MKGTSYLPSLSKIQDLTRAECEAQHFSSFFEVNTWYDLSMSSRLASTCLLVTSTAALLELVQTVSGKCSVLLSRRAHSRSLMKANTG